jgi:hypothetical protein
MSKFYKKGQRLYINNKHYHQLKHGNGLDEKFLVSQDETVNLFIQVLVLNLELIELIITV